MEMARTQNEEEEEEEEEAGNDMAFLRNALLASFADKARLEREVHDVHEHLDSQVKIVLACLQ